MSTPKFEKIVQYEVYFKKLSNTLKAAGVNFLWFIFTNDEKVIHDDNIVYVSPRLNAADYMQRADWFVQLSNNEAYCYSVVEALMSGTPVIVTPCPVFKELGLNSKNSITIDFDVSTVPIEKIKKGLKVPKYEPPADAWGELLGPGPCTYEPPKDTGEVLCQCIKAYDSIVTGERVERGRQLKLSKERAENLIKKGYVKRL